MSWSTRGGSLERFAEHKRVSRDQGAGGIRLSSAPTHYPTCNANENTVKSFKDEQSKQQSSCEPQDRLDRTKVLLDECSCGSMLEVKGVGECYLLERNPKVRRGLLLLRKDGSVEALEESLCVKVKRKSFAVGDAVMVPRTSLQQTFPSYRWRDGRELPKESWQDPLQHKRLTPYTRDTHSYGVIGVYSGGHLDLRRGWEKDTEASGQVGMQGGKATSEQSEYLRGKILRCGVFVNRLEVARGDVADKIQHESRKGQVRVQLLAEVNIDSAALRSTPNAKQEHIICTRPVLLTELCPVTEVHLRRFRNAAKEAARYMCVHACALMLSRIRACWHIDCDGLLSRTGRACLHTHVHRFKPGLCSREWRCTLQLPGEIPRSWLRC